MIRHILRLIWNQRRQNAWLWVELLLVSVFLWFLVDYLYVLGVTYTTPMGFDIRHTYQVVMSDLADKSPGYTPEEQLTQTPEEYLRTILDRLRVYPGVEAVCVSDGGTPYWPGSRNRNLKIDTISTNCGNTWVTPEYFEVFRLRGKDGTATSLMNALREPNTIVVTSDLGVEYPQALPLEGKTAYLSGVKNDLEVRIGAVCDPIRLHEYTRVRTFFYQDASSRLGDGASGVQICLRVRPDVDGPDFPARFRKDMAQQLRLGNLYLSDVESLAIAREEFIHSTGIENEAKTRLAVACFLLANIFLGIIGTFWFRTEYRKGEMGLRMALGSTRRQLNSILVNEGILLLVLAFIPALVISFNVANLDLVDTYLLPFTWLRFLICQSITFALIVCMIICGVWYPARQTAALEPAEALRYDG